jgi:hypothetical protein
MAKLISVLLTATELQDLVYHYEKQASDSESVASRAIRDYRKKLLQNAGRFQNRANELRKFIPNSKRG